MPGYSAADEQGICSGEVDTQFDRDIDAIIDQPCPFLDTVEERVREVCIGLTVSKAKLLHYLLFDVEPSSLVFVSSCGKTLAGSEVVPMGYNMTIKPRGGGKKKSSPGKKAARGAAGAIGGMVGRSAALASGNAELAPLLALLGSQAASGLTRRLQPQGKAKPAMKKKAKPMQNRMDDQFLSDRKSLSLVVPVSRVGFDVFYAVPLDVTSEVFPGQSYFAEAYGKWSAKRITFTYEPTVTPFNAPDGLIYLAWTPDALANAPLTVTDLDTFKYKACGMAQTKFSLSIPASPDLFTGSQSTGGQSANLRYHGKFFIVTICGEVMSSVGKLEVSSSILFKDFRRPSSTYTSSYYSLVTYKAKPILADNSTGVVTQPGAAGAGVVVSKDESGKFADCGMFVGWNEDQSRTIMQFSLDGFTVGDIFTVHRTYGIWDSDTPPLTGLQQWVEGPSPPAHGQTGSGNIHLKGNVQPIQPTPFQSVGATTMYGATPSYPRDVTETVPYSTFSGVAINTFLVTGGGACQVTLDTPFSVDSDAYALTNPDEWGMSLELNLIRFGNGVLPDTLSKRAPPKVFTDWRHRPCGRLPEEHSMSEVMGKELPTADFGDMSRRPPGRSCPSVGTDEETDEELIPSRSSSTRSIARR